MRFALALAAVLITLPAAAGTKCIARAHVGATPYIDEGTATEPPQPADTSRGSHSPGPNDAEVAGIDRDAHGQEWVYRVHEYAWRRQDVDLRGDCRHVGP